MSNREKSFSWSIIPFESRGPIVSKMPTNALLPPSTMRGIAYSAPKNLSSSFGSIETNGGSYRTSPQKPSSDISYVR